MLLKRLTKQLADPLLFSVTRRISVNLELWQEIQKYAWDLETDPIKILNVLANQGLQHITTKPKTRKAKGQQPNAHSEND